MFIFYQTSFNTKLSPEEIVNEVTKRKDFDFTFENWYLDFIFGRKAKFKTQPDGSVYLKVHKASTTKKPWLRLKIIFKIHAKNKESKVKVLLRPDLYLIYSSIFVIAFVFYLIIKEPNQNSFFLALLFFLIEGWVYSGIHKDIQTYKKYLYKLRENLTSKSPKFLK